MPGHPKGAPVHRPERLPAPDADPRIVQRPELRLDGQRSRSSFRYKKVQVSGLLDIRHGGQIWNGTKGALMELRHAQDTEQRAVCTVRSETGCTGNTKIFGQGGWYDGRLWARRRRAGPRSASTGIAMCGVSVRRIDEPCIEDGGLREAARGLPHVHGRRALVQHSSDSRVSTYGCPAATYTPGPTTRATTPRRTSAGPISAGAGRRRSGLFQQSATRSFTFSVTLNHNPEETDICVATRLSRSCHGAAPRDDGL